MSSLIVTQLFSIVLAFIIFTTTREPSVQAAATSTLSFF